MLSWIFGSPIDALGSRIMRREAVIKELLATIDDQDEIIVDLRKQNKAYYNLLFQGCELK